MSQIGYAVQNTGTPQKWGDDGYASVQADGYMHVVCGLTSVDSIVQSGTGIVTLSLSDSPPVNILSVQANVVGAANTDLLVHVVSVNKISTNAAGETSAGVVLQVVTASSGSAASLSTGQGLCLSLAYTKSAQVVGKAQQAGMV